MPQDWGAAYRDAVLETDPQKLARKVECATAILRDSMAKLDSSPEHLHEKQLMSDALRTLDMIQRLEVQSSSIQTSSTTISP